MLTFTVEQKEIFKALTALTRINAKAQKDSILQNILIEKVNDKKIQLTSSDLTTSVQYTISANFIEGDGILYNGQMILNIISRLSGQITFENNYIKCGRNKYKISTVDFKQYPKIDFDCVCEAIEYNYDEIKRIISEISHATSKIDGVLSGLYFNDNEIVTCDGNRICIDKIENCGNFILPRKLGEEIIRLFSDDIIYIQIKGNKIYVYDSKVILKGVLLAGKYPAYKSLLPSEQKNVVNFKKEDMLNALNMLFPILDLKYPTCKMFISSNKITLTGNSIGNEGSTEFDAKSNIDDVLEIGFNAQFLLDMLKNYEEDITMKIKETNLGVTFEDNKERYSMICPIVKKQP